LIGRLGLDVSRLSSLRYRGNGWPGRFAVTQDDGKGASITYEQSWGETLGPTVQWRCKICPDGIGESADIAAGDLWHVDDDGSPIFEEADGMSVVIVRTIRGQKLFGDAIMAGIVEAARIDIAELYSVQPLQVSRRMELAGRLLGAKLARVPTPKYRGFSLFSLALRRPIRAMRSGYGAFMRLRRSGRPKT
jgi:coenzyme F420 hydrogenase subunit beta